MAIEITRRELTAADLRAASGKARSARAARRMLAIALALEGVDRRTAAESCGMDRQTLRDWMHRYNAEGLAGLENRRSPDPPSRRRRRRARGPGRGGSRPSDRRRRALAPHRPEAAHRSGGAGEDALARHLDGVAAVGRPVAVGRAGQERLDSADLGAADGVGSAISMMQTPCMCMAAFFEPRSGSSSVNQSSPARIFERRRLAPALRAFQDQDVVGFGARAKDAGDGRDHPERADALRICGVGRAEIAAGPVLEPGRAVPDERIEVIADGMDRDLARDGDDGAADHHRRDVELAALQPFGGADVVGVAPRARQLLGRLAPRQLARDHDLLAELVEDEGASEGLVGGQRGDDIDRDRRKRCSSPCPARCSRIDSTSPRSRSMPQAEVPSR